jgi:hypothetical protein
MSGTVVYVSNADSGEISVLALDEAIIERGIGHRYSAYVLKDKKPQMPITGFEYLEKIVHLPFRIPALTTEQARRFVQKIEQEIEPDEAKRWFSPWQDTSRTETLEGEWRKAVAQPTPRPVRPSSSNPRYSTC